MARFSVFYRVHFGERAKDLHGPTPPSTFRHWDTRRGRQLLRHVVEMPLCCMSRFGSSFLMRTVKEWNALVASPDPTRAEEQRAVSSQACSILDRIVI